MAPVLYVVKPEPGDLIEIDRGFYQHWAVYVGEGFVANLASPCKFTTEVTTASVHPSLKLKDVLKSLRIICFPFSPHLVFTVGRRGGQSSSVRSLVADRAVVKREELWVVVGDNQWRINNGLDKMYQPRPSHIIVKAAGELVGQQRPYCVLRDNCEHFVNNLRYGIAVSLQVLKAKLLALASLLATSLLFGIVSGAGALCMI
uniref:Phospholipase A and acyltransferase 3-like n=1 Tax=Takifugu rubripes TaxID=31033 RepID=A0A3B5JWY8_TAKRU